MKMTPITSLFDFHEKIKVDERYKKMAVIAVERSGWDTGEKVTYEKVLVWIDNWVRTNKQPTCNRIVMYLNDQIKRVPNWNVDLPAQAPTVVEAPATPPAVAPRVSVALEEEPSIDDLLIRAA